MPSAAMTGSYRRLVYAYRTMQKFLPRNPYTTNAVAVPFEEDIPIVVVSHAVKRAYVVNPMATVPRILEKYCWLTKTSIVDEMPQKCFGYDVTSDTIDNFTDFLIQNSKRSVPTKGGALLTDDEQKLGLLYGLFQLGLAEVKSDTDTSKYYLDSDPILKTHWLRTFDYYQLEHKPSLVLRASTPLPDLPDCFKIYDEELLNKPGPFNTYSMNLYRHSAIKLQNNPGYFNSKQSPYRHINTLLLSTRPSMKDIDLVAGCLVSSFAHLLSEALDHNELFGTQLEEPKVAHCIATDGKRIAFAVYKLNTLSLQDDRGIWNHAWTAGPFKLLDDDPKYEAESDETTFDLQFVDYFMNMLSRSL